MLEPSQIEKIQKTINEDDIIVATVFSILGDKNRFRIFKILTQNGELCVSDLASVLDISISSASQHLRILEMSGMVMGERMGQMMCYKPLLDNPKVKAIINLL
jgi:DNA-binding transcriptional ArsR family regulator